MYLEDQTDGLVESITAMVDAIRSGEAMPAIRTHITTIAGTIENIVGVVERTAGEPSSFQATLSEKSRTSATTLQECREQLLKAGSDSTAYDGLSESKDFTQKLPPMAFQIARETKELVSRIMAIEVGHGDDDFS